MMYDEIKMDLKKYMADGERRKVSTLRVLLSDIQRDPNKDYSDEKITKVIFQIVKSLRLLEKITGESNTDEINFLNGYLLEPTSSEDINKVLAEIDFSKLKNKMQAIGIVMKKFPAGSVDGNMVKKMVEEWE